MNLILTLSTFISFISVITGQEPPAIPSVESLKSYHTKVTVTDAGKRSKYEEFYDALSKRGRLSITSEDDVQNIFYTSKPAQRATMRKWDRFTNCTVEDTSDSGTVYDMLDVDKNGGVIMGPMAVWRKIYRIRGEEAGPDAFTHEYGKIRGVEVSVYNATLRNDEKGREIKVSLAFMKPNWTRFEDVNAQVPVRFIVKGSERGRPIDHQFDFFLIEEASPESIVSDLQPSPGIGCPGFQSPPEASFPGTMKTFPNQVAFSLEVYDMINDSNQTMIKRHDMAYDGEEMIARFDNYIPDQEEADVYIQDLRRGIVYRKDNAGKCEIGHVSDSVDDRFIGYAHGMRTIRTLKQILNIDGDYYNLGKAQRRGITLDVWETVIDVNDVELDVMLGTSAVKRVITHFFSKETIMEDMFRQVLIMSLVTDFTDDGIERQVVSQKEMSYFDFRELNFGDTYLDTFNVADCITDPAGRRYFDIFIKHIDDSGSGASQIDLTKHSAQIRQLTQKMVSDYSRISTIRVPQVNIIHEKNEGVMLNVLVLEKEDSIVSFRRKESVGNQAKPTIRDVKFKVIQENDCADLALGNSTLGTDYKSFLYCSGTCYLRYYGPDDSQGGEPRNETNDCDLYERSLLGTDGRDLVAEPGLKEVERLLFEAFADENLRVKIKDPNQEAEQVLVVSSIVVSRSEEDDMDKREEPFRESSPGFKIKIAETSKTIPSRDSSEQLTIGECYLSCKEEDSMTCQTFTFCDSGIRECVISSLLIDETSEGDPENGPLEINRNCSTYSMSYLHRFDKLPGSVDEITGDVFVKKSKDAATCAKECSSFVGQFKCESFAFCGSECILRKEHIFEVTTNEPTESQNTRNVTGKGCNLYHLKTLLDYVVTGIDLVAGDDVLTKQDGIDANTCANFCNRETDCTSINFCNNPGTTSCELTMSSPYEPSAVTVRNDRCTNYVQKASLVPGWGVKNGDPTAPQQSSNRMGGGAFFGVICAMIILGLVLGVASVLGYNWYRNKGTGLGLGVSVKYVRQNNDNLISNEEQPVTSFSTAVPLD